MPATKLLVTGLAPKNRLYEKQLLVNEYDHLFKFLIIGDSGVGKSCLLLRLADGSYTESYISTIGADFKTKIALIQDKRIKMQIWDTQGNIFRNMRKPFGGAHGIILAFDLTDLDSFENLTTYLHEIDKFAGDHVRVILVGNKADALPKRKISESMVDTLLTSHPNIIAYVETSAKYDINVDEAFKCLAQERLLRATLMTNGPEPLVDAVLWKAIYTHSQQLRIKIHNKSSANAKLNPPVTSDAEIEMWQQKLTTLAVAERIMKGERNLAYDFFKAQYGNSLHASGMFAKTPQLLAQVEAFLPKDNRTQKAQLLAKIESHINKLQMEINTAPTNYRFWQCDKRNMWQKKIEVLQATRDTLKPLDATSSDRSAIKTLQDKIQSTPLYSKGIFSKTDKYVSQVVTMLQSN